MSKNSGLRINTRVMAPLGEVLHRGVIVEPPVGQPAGEGMVCVKFTPPVKTPGPFNSINYITCPASRVTIGWF
jgi:hypothetical protein